MIFSLRTVNQYLHAQRVRQSVLRIHRELLPDTADVTRESNL
jgi:hypothetical protein